LKDGTSPRDALLAKAVGEGDDPDGLLLLVELENKRCQRCLAGVDRAIVLDEHDGFRHASRFRAVETVELLQMRDEVAAAFRPAGMHDETPREVVERADYRDLFGLPRCRHAQVGAAFRPRPRQIRMRQRLALVAVEQNPERTFIVSDKRSLMSPASAWALRS
jgi:hypothetical protein